MQKVENWLTIDTLIHIPTQQIRACQRKLSIITKTLHLPTILYVSRNQRDDKIKDNFHQKRQGSICLHVPVAAFRCLGDGSGSNNNNSNNDNVG